MEQHNLNTGDIHSHYLMLLSGAMVLLNNITASGIISMLTICVLSLTAIKLYYDIQKARKGK